ncbi:hypothetical protein BOX15_Mlig012095g1, partial [Macrostomum lignano]
QPPRVSMEGTGSRQQRHPDQQIYRPPPISRSDRVDSGSGGGGGGGGGGRGGGGGGSGRTEGAAASAADADAVGKAAALSAGGGRTFYNKSRRKGGHSAGQSQQQQQQQQQPPQQKKQQKQPNPQAQQQPKQQQQQQAVKKQPSPQDPQLQAGNTAGEGGGGGRGGSGGGGRRRNRRSGNKLQKQQQQQPHQKKQFQTVGDADAVVEFFADDEMWEPQEADQHPPLPHQPPPPPPPPLPQPQPSYNYRPRGGGAGGGSGRREKRCSESSRGGGGRGGFSDSFSEAEFDRGEVLRPDARLYDPAKDPVVALPSPRMPQQQQQPPQSVLNPGQDPMGPQHLHQQPDAESGAGGQLQQQQQQPHTGGLIRLPETLRRDAMHRGPKDGRQVPIVVVRPQSHHAQPQPAMQSEESQAAAEHIEQVCQLDSELDRLVQQWAPSMDPQVWWGLVQRPRLDLLHRCADALRAGAGWQESNSGPQPALDQRMWRSGFHAIVEQLRQMSGPDQPERLAERGRELALDMIESGWQFLQQLADQLAAEHELPVELPLRIGFLPPAVRCTRWQRLGLLLIQRLYLNIGDLLRYREVFSGGADYSEARSWYLKAVALEPKNGRTYHQLAVLANATKRRLDAVYYYMRSLAASHPVDLSRQYLAQLFEEARRRAEAAWRQREAERSKRQRAKNAGSSGPSLSSGGLRALQQPNRRCRVEVWVPVSGAGRQLSSGLLNSDEEDVEQEEDLDQLSFIEINTAFTASYLHCHGKLFTRIGMESFQEACSQTLLELAAWLRHEPPAERLLQLAAGCVFSASWAARQGPPGAAQYRSVQLESAVRLALDFAAVLARHCRHLLAEHVKHGGCLPLPEPTRALLSSLKLLLDWMEVSPEAWNPPPLQRDPHLQPQLDVWEDLASLFTDCARFSNRPEVRRQLLDFEESKKPPISPPGSCRLHVILQEDVFANGFTPMLNRTPIFYVAKQAPAELSAVTDAPEAWSVRERLLEDSVRLDACAVFADYLCGLEPPLLGYSMEAGGAYFSQQLDKLASERMEDCQQPQPQPPSLEFAEAGIQDEPDESGAASADDELAASAAADGIRELRLRKQELRRALDEQQERQRAYKSALESSGQRYMELEIVPINLLPDTNCYIHYLGEIRSLLAMGKHNLILPIVVLNELDHLAKHGDSSEHAGYVASQARAAVAMLEEAFESKAGGAARRRVKAVTAKGSTLDTIAFRSEVIGRPAKNDDLILSCCMNHCQDKASAFMPKDKDQPVRLHRDIVLLTSDRNLRLKAIGSNIPAKTVPAFFKWSGLPMCRN